MGLYRRAAIAIKTTFGRPLTRADIYQYAHGLIKRPPIPPEGRELFSKPFANLNGVPVTVLDYYRQELIRPDLDKLAAKPTWELQRVECIRQIFRGIDWRNMYFCLKNAKSDWGRGIVYQKLEKLWKNKTKEQMTYLLTIWYMMLLTEHASIGSIGKALYKFDSQMESEVDLCLCYSRDIMLLDVNMMDIFHENYAGDPEAVYYYAGRKDDQLNPITARMRQVFEAAQNSIAYGAFNIDEFRREVENLHTEKARLAQSVLVA